MSGGEVHTSTFFPRFASWHQHLPSLSIGEHHCISSVYLVEHLFYVVRRSSSFLPSRTTQAGNVTLVDILFSYLNV